jgi:uncharacterized protein (UPF0276 family)
MPVSSIERRAGSHPADPGLLPRTGIGFKPQHLHDLLADPCPPAFIEVHAENYMGAGGAPHARLRAACERVPLSLHGVGLSIGADSPPDEAHLERLAALIERYRPVRFSEHLAWSTHDGRFLDDLLPLTYDTATLVRVCEHIDRIQQHLGLRMLLENPSTYFEFEASTMEEPDFIDAIVQRTGCGLLLDINNVEVSCHNNGRDPHAYLAALPLPAVAQIHLAGHSRHADKDGYELLLDDHGAPVAASTWALYAHALALTGPVATLIEWDNAVPGYAALRAQAALADRIAATLAGPPCVEAA